MRMFSKADWDEDKHPRGATTDASTPGSFAPAGGGGKSSGAVAKIAQHRFGIETLEERKSDRLDFHDVAVWSVKDALGDAYEAGRRAGGATTSGASPTAALAKIAKDQLNIETLETRKSDSLDFHNVGVLQVKGALGAAYEAGRAGGFKDADHSPELIARQKAENARVANHPDPYAKKKTPAAAQEEDWRDQLPHSTVKGGAFLRKCAVGTIDGAGRVHLAPTEKK